MGSRQAQNRLKLELGPNAGSASGRKTRNHQQLERAVMGLLATASLYNIAELRMAFVPRVQARAGASPVTWEHREAFARAPDLHPARAGGRLGLSSAG